MPPLQTPCWRRFSGLAPYEQTCLDMEKQVAAIRAGHGSEQIWLLEHPPLYTAGTSSRPGDLLSPARFPVHESGRGGQYTYHGPGQRICYVMLDLQRRGKDVRLLIRQMENWLILALEHFGVRGEIRQGRVGVWVQRPDKTSGSGQMREDKIAAIGIRVRHWVSFHGLSLNVCPNLEHYSGIVPCGIAGHGITSLHDLGINASMSDVDTVLQNTFAKAFDNT